MITVVSALDSISGNVVSLLASFPGLSLEEVRAGTVLRSTLWADDRDLSGDERTAVVALARAHGWVVEGAPTLLAVEHGAHPSSAGDLHGWDPDRAFPGLTKLSDVGARGFLWREAWYRRGDVGPLGYGSAPLAGCVPVVEILYPWWEYGTIPGTATRGLLRRGPTTTRYYDVSGGIAYEVAEPEPKPYTGVRAALAASERRRINVVGSTDSASDSRLGALVVGALVASFPGEDPGSRAAALLGRLASEIGLYRSSGEGLHAALSDKAILTDFPWLDPVLDAMIDEVTEPDDGVITAPE